ncbi:MAG TPA: hypothetical protein VK943_11560 [Arenibaculum sp.]|nr:hypothetical protein [Arenibaculum sp.]
MTSAALLRSIAVTLALSCLLAVAACAGIDTNPLTGRWIATTPALPSLTLGTYEFRRDSMTALGITQPVDYSVSGNTVLVVPEGGPGIALEVEIVDTDTARVNVPVLGGLVTLRRVERAGWF